MAKLWAILEIAVYELINKLEDLHEWLIRKSFEQLIWIYLKDGSRVHISWLQDEKEEKVSATDGTEYPFCRICGEVSLIDGDSQLCFDCNRGHI